MSNLVLNSENNPLVERAFQDYLELGKERSVLALHKKYTDVSQRDPNVLLPSLVVSELAQCEVQYNRRDMAIQYDSQEQQAWNSRRATILRKLYDTESEMADLIKSKALEAIEELQADSFSPGDVLRFVTEALKMKRAAVEMQLSLEDPEKQEGENSGDWCDKVRRLVQAQNTTNVFIQQNIKAKEQYE